MLIRFFDIIFSLITIIIIFPFTIPIMIILKMTGEHNIFYLQTRIGKENRKFKVFKFATMLKNSPNLPGGLITQFRDPRILPLGNFLRKTKINELPQLLNVLFGQMSFVGPRPVVIQHFNLYPEKTRNIILEMNPGLTGIASLIFRDEEEILDRLGGDREYYHNDVIAPYKGELEIWWYNNRTIINYFKIIILTAWSLIDSRSELWKKWFQGLPTPPEILNL